MNTATVINVLSAGMFAGALVWLLCWPLAWGVPKLRFGGAFADLVPTVPGESARRDLRAAERDLTLLAAAACGAVAAFLVLLVYGSPRLTGVWMWVLFGLACALFVAWWVFLVRVSLRWRLCRYAARAHAALASALGRLAMQGHRVFHDLTLGEVTVDHLVMGKLGVFAIKLVARRPGKLGNISRINGRSIEFQDGFALLDTIALAERGARSVADMQVKGLSHRIHVQPVVAVPGWEIAPSQGQAGDVFLINEKTAVMLLRNSKPAYHLMDEDGAVLQEHLVRFCVNRAL
ncbi:MAG: hypothetical protein ACM3ZT_10765 [Bacillota bacterium]